MLKLGTIVMTLGASEALSNQDILEAIVRHERCDWGDVPRQDWEANDDALVSNGRILSSYQNRKGVQFWIITEWDRGSTTVLLPEEY